MLSEIDKEIFREIILSDGYVSSINLATICNVSINTIRKSVDNINDFLSDKYCYIDSKISSGYCLVFTNKEKAIDFIDQAIDNIERFRYLDASNLSSAYRIVFLLFSSSNCVSVDKIANYLYCSRSTVVRILDNVKIILKKFSLELKNKRNDGFYIEGNEFSKRNCLSFLEKVYKHTELDFQKSIYDDLFFNNKLRTKIKNTVLSITSNHDDLPFHIVNSYNHSITNWIIISNIRRKYKSDLRFSQNFVDKAKSLMSYNLAKEIYAALNFIDTSEIDEIDYIALSAVIFCCSSFSDLSAIDSNTLKLLKEETDQFVSFLNDYYALDDYFPDEFYKQFYLYLYSLSYKKTFNYIFDDEHIFPSIRMGLFSSDMLAIFALFIKVKHNIILQENDLIDAYFILNTAAITSNNKISMNYDINGAVVARKGRFQGENIKARINFKYNNIFKKLDVLEYSQVFNKSINNYDLLLVNFDTSHNDISDYYNNDIIKIDNIHSNNMLNKLSYYIKNKNAQMALSIFTEENFHHCDFKSKQEVFLQIYQYVKDLVGSKESFINDLFQRDNFVTFEKNNGIVMICPLAYKFEKPMFHLFVNKNPISWKNKKNTIFIFYSRGSGTRNEISIISFLLKHFLHQPLFFINTLYQKSYKEIANSFK